MESRWEEHNINGFAGRIRIRAREKAESRSGSALKSKFRSFRGSKKIEASRVVDAHKKAWRLKMEPIQHFKK